MTINQEYQKAVDYWTMALDTTEADLERAWLSHDIGRCHYELGAFDQAAQLGLDAVASAEAAGDERYTLDSNILVGRSHGNHSLVPLLLVPFFFFPYKCSSRGWYSLHCSFMSVNSCLAAFPHFDEASQSNSSTCEWLQ